MNIKSFLITGIFLFFLGGFSFAQYPPINNGGFENWDNLGSNSVEPASWNSFMTANSTWLTSFGKKKRVDRSNVKRPGSAGTYSAIIWSTNETVAIANGNLTCGKINMGSTNATDPSNYNYTASTESGFNHSFIGHPDSLVVWLRFKPASGGAEQARMNAVIHDSYDLKDPADAGSTSHVVGSATLNFPKTSGLWVRKSIPFVYSGPATTSAYILISFTTNMTPGGGSAGDSLYIDDLEVIYNTNLSVGTISPATYYVSPTQSSAINIPYTVSGPVTAGNTFTAVMSDAAGNFASPLTIGSVAATASGTINATIPANTITGSGYRIKVISSAPGVISSANSTDIQIYNVNNSVSPLTAQNIDLGIGGAAITVTENPAATSREWKFATVSTGPYTSFTPGETGTTYTPLFNTAGTYYVICESVIGGITVNSAEVTVNVVDPTGIENIDQKSVSVFWSGNSLNVNLQQSTFSNAVLKIYNVCGQLAGSLKLSDNSMNRIELSLPEGIYYYQLTDREKTITGKVFKR
jgi:hypothetical protein